MSAESDARDAHLNFLMAEIGAGIAFAEDARFSRDADRKARRLKYAKQAHDSVTQFKKRVPLEPVQAKYVEEGLVRLAQAIKAAE